MIGLAKLLSTPKFLGRRPASGRPSSTHLTRSLPTTQGLKPTNRRLSSMDEALENLTQSAASSPSPTNEGWFAYLPEGGERMELKFSEEIETQFALVEANQGNRHMRYDLVTLCLRAIRVPLTEDFARTCAQGLANIAGAEKFQEQLKAQLARHITPLQRLDIKAKIGEHKQKLIKANWANIPLMAAYAHFLMLDAQLSLAHEVVSKALLLTQSDYYFQQAVHLERRQQPNFEEAALMYGRSIAKNPLNSAALTNLAVLEWYHNIDTTKALYAIEDEILKAKPLPKGYNMPKRKPYERNRQFIEKKTVELLNRAIAADISRENFIAHYHIAFIYETSVGDATKAREHYSRALEINPDHMHSHTNLASLLMDEKLYDKALHHYEQAKVLAPDQVLVYLNLANCLGRKGSIEAAVKEMQKAIRRDPSMPHLHYHLGMILARAKHLEDAVAAFERALQLHGIYPDHEFDPAPTYNMMISILRELANRTIANGESIPEFEVAGKQLARCLDLLPEGSNLVPTVLTNLAHCFMKSNRPEAALEALEDAQQRFGEDYAEAFRQVQQTGEPDQVYAQLNEHISNIEQAEAMLRYLLERPEKADPVPAASTGSTSSKSKSIVKGLKKKKILKKKTKSSVSTTKKAHASTLPPAEEHDLPFEDHTAVSDGPLDEEYAAPSESPINGSDATLQEEEEDLSSSALPSGRDSELETILNYKARLHYNIAFCMSYLGELEETKHHLRLAIESDPQCTSDYVITEEQMMQKRAMEQGIEEDQMDVDAFADFQNSATRSTQSAPRGDSPHQDEDMDDDVPDLYDMDDGPPELTRKAKRQSKRKFVIPVVRPEPVTSSSIRKASRAKAYTPEGLTHQLNALMYPKDGSKPTAATMTLLQFLEDCKEKAANVDLEEFNKQLAGTPRPQAKTVRSAKSRRRKDLKYSISASRRSASAGFNDGFDSPL